MISCFKCRLKHCNLAGALPYDDIAIQILPVYLIKPEIGPNLTEPFLTLPIEVTMITDAEAESTATFIVMHPGITVADDIVSEPQGHSMRVTDAIQQKRARQGARRIYLQLRAQENCALSTGRHGQRKEDGKQHAGRNPAITVILNLHFDKITQLTLIPSQQAQSPAGIAAPVDQQQLSEEVQALHEQHHVLAQGDFDLYLVQSSSIPTAMLEIGRLRELTFRAVGEGTGQPRDLDAYDEYYWQLFIWDRNARCIAGGYRMGEGDKIMRERGIPGFYIASLFEIADPFAGVLSQAVELGRSFVTPEYQKKRLPLFLLWKGILFFLLQNLRYRYLIGPVSVSKYYSDISKSLIIGFVRKHYFDEHYAQYIEPRTPFAYAVDEKTIAEKLESLSDLDALEDLIETIEPNHITLPVLLKQYIRQNARFIGFNLDPNFNDALDGLMLLDLMHVRKETIENLKKSW